jgi:3-dehydrosphinganine reductase
VLFSCCVCRILRNECIHTHKVRNQRCNLNSILLSGLAECLRQEMILFGIDVHCVFPGSILSPGYANEQRTKPSLTCEIEGDETMTPNAVAKETLARIALGHVFIVCEPIGELLLAANLGFLPVNNQLVHVVALAVSVIVCPILRIFYDGKVRRDRGKQLSKKTE